MNADLYISESENVKELKMVNEVNKKMSGDLTKYAFFPIQYPELAKYYHQQKAVFWTAQEIDYVSDRNDWDHLDENVNARTPYNKGRGQTKV